METLGSFRIIDRLGAGALGTLYHAQDARTGRSVALRLVQPSLAADAERRPALLADARAAAVSHPNAAGLIEIVEDGDRLLLVEELAAGRPLRALLAGGPLEARQAIHIASQVALALGAGQQQGVAHLALDPSGILVAADGGVKLLDLGMSRWTGCGSARRAAARALEGGMADDATSADAAGYLAPEQVLGAPGDGRSDIFSLGVILYEMLTGRRPFAPVRVSAPAGAEGTDSGKAPGGSAAPTLLEILRTSPLPPSELNPAVPPGVDAILKRALAKSVEARYPRGGEMAADLDALGSSLPALRKPDPVAAGGLPAPRPEAERDAPAAATLSRSRSWPRRERHTLAAAALLVLLLAAGAAAWLYRADLLTLVRGTPPPPSPPTLVVIPFDVPSELSAPHFGTGFAEGVANRLSELPGTTVVGRTSIRSLGARNDWQVRARRLGATVAIGGSIRPGPYAVHADVEVFDVATGQRRWSRHFEREPRQVFGLEVEISGQLAQYFHLPTPPSDRWQRSALRQVDPVAYDLYLQGRDAAERRDRSRAIALYDEALQRDPRLVEARANLALALYLEEYYAGSSREPAAAGRALREAEAALAVDAELASAHVAAALAAPGITAAASSLARALTYDPSNGEAWHHAGDLVSELQPARSIAFYQRSLAFEPTLDANWRDLASVQAAMGHQAAAAESTVKGEALRPDRPWWKQMRGRLELEAHRYDAPAAAALLTDPSSESMPIVWLMGRVIPLAMAGRLADARREANGMYERYPAFCEGRAVLAAVEIDGGSHARGAELATAILAEAARSDAGPEVRACAALAAAATGDAAETAGWLAKVAADERALRVWTRQATFGVALSFRSRWYPWTKVLGSQPVQTATAQLDSSLERLSSEVERRLPSPRDSLASPR